MTLSSLQGESQVNVFHLLVEMGLLPFYKLHLVLSGCRVQDREATGEQDALQNYELCGCLKTFEDLSESRCSRTRVKPVSAGFINITSITTCTQKFIDHTRA